MPRQAILCCQKHVWASLLFTCTLAHCAGNTMPAADFSENAASATSGLATGSAYTLINNKSNLALDLQDASGQHGTPVIVAPVSHAASQQWTLRPGANNSLALINVQTRQALDVTDGNTAAGTPLQAWTDENNSHQQWTVADQGNGLYQIVAVLSGKCLDLTSGSAAAGTVVQQWDCSAHSDEMLWRMDPVASAAAPSNSNPDSTSPAATTPSTTASGSGAYSTSQLTADMHTVLQLRTPIYSNRNLGNPSNVAMWTPDKIQSLLNGIITAHEVFYPNIGLVDLAHLIVAEGAQESTGDYNLAGWSVGFIQSTPSTVGVDYANHGTAVTSSVGTMIAPQTPINYDDPGQNVVTWAWYTHNAVAAGESVNEVALGNPQGTVTRDFGNAEFDWLAGPHNDRHNPAQAAAFQDYHDRIKDYFVQSGFGSAAQFENLLNTPVSAQLIDFR